MQAIAILRFYVLSGTEKQIGIIRDIILPLDINTRYDLYFTDRRVAIVCMGRANRFESQSQGQFSLMPSAFGVPPPTSSYVEKTQVGRAVEEEIKDWSIDDILRLSKKSCFYDYDEIEEVKLVLGRKPKFGISSQECESKFVPDEAQVKQLITVLPAIEVLRNKLLVAGSWNTLQEMFKNQTAGKKTKEEACSPDPLTELTCSRCRTKNKAQESFCQQCGAPISLK
jgi:hypothetical protein